MQHILKQDFLRERLLVLFHKDTLDSYRVRIHNTNSLLKELKQLLQGWEEKRVQRFETVKYCAEELINSLKNDSFISIDCFNKELLIDDLSILVKTDSTKYDIQNLIFLLNKLLIENKDVYIQRLFDEIQNYVFAEDDFSEQDFIPVMERIDNVASKLATELINIGYSKAYIFSIIKKISSTPLNNFKTEFDAFKKLILTRKLLDFILVFKVVSKIELGELNFISELKEEIDTRCLTTKIARTYSSFINTDKYSKFWINSIKAYDHFTAIKKSKAKLYELLDKIHLGYNGLTLSVHPRALAINIAEKNMARLNPVDYMFDGSFESNKELYQKISSQIYQIEGNNTIALDVKDRIFSALRYLRLGNNTIDIEQRFINYWIGLEFIFSFPEKNQNTFTRLKENIVTILVSCYLKRNLYILNQSLIKEEYISEQTLFWKQSEIDLDVLISRINSPFLRYQIQKTKPLIYGNSDKRSKYIKKHEENLQQNISRIYHLRNELIHEAALKQDIENITSILRYYLVFVLDQLINYFSKLPNEIHNNKKFFNIDDAFYEFKLFKRMIEKDWNFDVIMAVPVEIELIDKKAVR